MTNFTRFAGRSAIFALSPIGSALSPLLAIPIVVSYFGVDSWANLAVGQGLGLFASVLVELALPLNALSILRGLSASSRSVEYLTWLRVRVWVFLIVCVPLSISAAVAVDDRKLETALSAVVFASLGLSATWFHAALGSPWTLFWRETLIRLGSAPIGAGLAAASGNLLVFPMVQLGLSLLAVVAVSRPHRLVVKAIEKQRSGVGVVGLIRSQLRYLAVRSSTTALQALPLALVSHLAPIVLPIFASIDRLSKFVVTGAVPALQAMQGILGDRGAGGVPRESRLRPVVMITSVISIVCALTVLALAQAASDLLFRGQIELSVGVVLWASLATGAAVWNRGLQLVIAEGVVRGFGPTIIFVVVLIGLVGVAISSSWSVELVLIFLFGSELMSGVVVLGAEVARRRVNRSP